MRSSSIFSFDYLRAWTRLNFRERAHWVLSAVMLGIVAVASDRARGAYWQGKLPPTFRTMAVAELARHQPELVFVGSSHVYTAVDPSHFSRRTVNLSDSGLNYQCAEVLCDLFHPQVHGADCVIIELDAFPVYKDTIGMRKGDFRDFWEWGLTGWQLPVNQWTKFSGEVNRLSGVGRGAPLVPAELFDLHQTDKVLGPGFKGRIDRMQPEAKEAFFRDLGTEFPQEIVFANLNALKRLVNRLSGQGVRLCLLRMPFHEDYWRHPTSQLRERYAEQAIEHIRSHCPSGVPEIIDLRHMAELQDTHFSDWTHLSVSGAAVVSEELDRLLSSP